MYRKHPTMLVLFLATGLAGLSAQTVDQGSPPQAVMQRALVRVLEGSEVLLEMPVTFPAFSAALTNPDGMIEELNRKTANAVADVIQEKGRNGIRVVAYSDPSFAHDAKNAEEEQRYVLIPLSRARAQSLVDAVVENGLDPSWFTVSGMGSEAPLYAYDDEENHWKNRRIEFQLVP